MNFTVGCKIIIRAIVVICKAELKTQALHLGKYPERFGLFIGDTVSYTEQSVRIFSKSQRYGWLVCFGHDSCAWVQWMDGDRELIGSAWLTKQTGPREGKGMDITIDEMKSALGLP